MHIAIDGHTIGTQLAGNVTYVSKMLESLAAIDDENRYTVYVTRPAAKTAYEGRWPNVEVRQVGAVNRALRYFISFRRLLEEDRPDIFFVQFTAPPRLKCSVVDAIHDLSFEHIPETFRWHEAFRMRVAHRRAAREAAHIITPSECSRSDVINTYCLPEDKVTAIPLAASEDFRPDIPNTKIEGVRRRYSLPQAFILGVGSVQPRKNLVRLIEAYSAVAAVGDVPPLIIAGRLAWLYGDSVAAAARYGVKDKVRFMGFVPDEDLPALYRAATCFVYPSFFEGFGLPPLEAMQCGTPVITGDRTSLPEVVGDGGILVDPFDVDAIAAALKAVLSDEKLRSDLRRNGLARAKQFSWAETARQTLGVFERVVDGKN